MMQPLMPRSIMCTAHGLVEVPRAREVDVEHALPLLERHLLGRGTVADAGVGERGRGCRRAPRRWRPRRPPPAPGRPRRSAPRWLAPPAALMPVGDLAPPQPRRYRPRRPRAPYWAKPSATARPRPEPPPVTSAVLPASEKKSLRSRVFTRPSPPRVPARAHASSRTISMCGPGDVLVDGQRDLRRDRPCCSTANRSRCRCTTTSGVGR